MSEKLSGGVRMRELIATVAGPVLWSDNRQSWLARAARRAGISCRQVKSLWYGEITDECHRSARLMRDAAEEITGIAAALDQDRYREEIAEILDLVRQMRAQDRSAS